MNSELQVDEVREAFSLSQLGFSHPLDDLYVSLQWERTCFSVPGKGFLPFPLEVRVMTGLGSFCACLTHCFFGLGSNFMI